LAKQPVARKEGDISALNPRRESSIMISSWKKRKGGRKKRKKEGGKTRIERKEGELTYQSLSRQAH
jgi:hypothetical protein